MLRWSSCKYATGMHFLPLCPGLSTGAPQEIVVAGESSDPTSQEFLDVLRSKYLPQAIILQNQPGRDGQRLKSIAPTAVDKIPLDGKTAVYVCENYACQAPVTNQGTGGRIVAGM